MFNFVKISEEIDSADKNKLVNEIYKTLPEFKNKFIYWIKEYFIKVTKLVFKKHNKEFTKSIQDQLLGELELFFIINSINIEDEFNFRLDLSDNFPNNFKYPSNYVLTRALFIDSLESELIKFLSNFKLDKSKIPNVDDIDNYLENKELSFFYENLSFLDDNLYANKHLSKTDY